MRFPVIPFFIHIYPTFCFSVATHTLLIFGCVLKSTMAPSKKGWQMIEIISVLVSLCLISVVIRVVARLQRRVRFGIDDYLSMVSMVLLIAMLIELILCMFLLHRIAIKILTAITGCTIGGNGAHMADLSPETLMNYWKVCTPISKSNKPNLTPPRSSSPTNSPTSCFVPVSKSPSSASTDASSQPQSSKQSPSA